MAKKISQTTLNASTLDILNVIRQNASYSYQQEVPEVTDASQIPAVGAIIYGTPAHANQFLNALVNRIAMVKLQSATFNNPYAVLKKGYVEFGESIEDIFVNIANVVEYNPEKGEQREFKRTIPDVRSVFHMMNWRTVYPITINDDDLHTAFLSIDGVTELITKIIDQVYTAEQYDEFLLFKYLLIKAVSHGKMYPQSIGDGTDASQGAKAFRTMSNVLPFMSSTYNEAGVKTTTPTEKQVIFMDAKFNAEYDVDVLAGAFNMEKADFIGRLFLIDNWTEFDNERFEEIRKVSDGIEEVTTEELALMKDVKAVLCDEEWFQVYDNMNKMTEKYNASSLYWNYFYHTWKTVSYSPFANSIVFVTDSADITLPDTITVEVSAKDTSETATVLTLDAKTTDGASLKPNDIQFVQTEDLVKAGIAVQKYGAVIIPASATATEVTLVATVNGTTYTAKTTINSATEVSATVELAK